MHQTDILNITHSPQVNALCFNSPLSPTCTTHQLCRRLLQTPLRAGGDEPKVTREYKEGDDKFTISSESAPSEPSSNPNSVYVDQLPEVRRFQWIEGQGLGKQSYICLKYVYMCQLTT